MMHKEHRTRAAERWDAIAYQYYGDAHAYERIMRANPDVPRDLLLPEGIVLIIPVDETDVPETRRAREIPSWLKI